MKCKNCHHEFAKRHPSQKFCSRKCKDDWWNRKKPDRHKDPDYYSKYNIAHGRYSPYYNPYDIDDHGLDSFNEPVY